MTSGDDTIRGLFADLSAIADVRAADDEAEQATRFPQTDRERAGLAIEILGTARPWSIDDRRLLSLPRDADADRRLSTWLATVEALVAQLEPELVVDAWLAAVESGREGWRLCDVGARALCRLPSIRMLADRLTVLLVAPQHGGAREQVRDALAQEGLVVDDALVVMLDQILTATEYDVEAADAAIAIAGRHAAKSRALAAIIAERARRDRGQRRADALAFPDGPRRAVDSWALAEAVTRAGRTELIPTALLECTRDGRAHSEWARTLAAIAGEDGMRHLLDRSPCPGWSLAPITAMAVLGDVGDPLRRAFLDHPDPGVRIAAARACPDGTRRRVELAAVFASVDRAGGWTRLRQERESARRDLDARTPEDDWDELARRHGEPLQLSTPPTPLEAVTSRFADLRRHAVDNLADVPRPDHLLALLLGADLDRHMARKVYRWSWQRLDPLSWLPLFYDLVDAAAPGLKRPMDDMLVRAEAVRDRLPPGPSLFSEQIGLLRANGLLEELLDARVFVRDVPVPQRLTPELEELLAVGPAAYAERFPPPAGLMAEARAELEAAEAAFAAEADQRGGGAGGSGAGGGSGDAGGGGGRVTDQLVKI